MGRVGELASQGFHSAVNAILEYDTPKIVHIKSKKVGLLNRFIQLAILGYIIGYAIVWEKGYQEFDTVVAAVSTKLKGIAFTNFSEGYAKNRVWDVADYVIPAQENGAFFILTNAIITRGQSQGECEEDPSIPDGRCEVDDNCTYGEPVLNGDGIKLGVCMNSTRNHTVRVCKIRAWCPTEQDDAFPIKGQPLLQEAINFTVLIKNQIEFPKFNAKRRNIAESQNQSYLQSCRYNSQDPEDKFCPIFRIGDIVETEAKENFTQMALTGGFISIDIYWDCNLDKSIDHCVPKYSFRRLDNKNSQIAKGWNFRYANYYYKNETEYRDLIKAYGIRFVITVTGQAGKFSFVPLILSLGSGLALLAISTVLCDIIAIYILKKGAYYKEKKYLYVVDDDATVEPQPTGNSAPPEGGVQRRTTPGTYNRLDEEDE